MSRSVPSVDREKENTGTGTVISFNNVNTDDSTLARDICHILILLNPLRNQRLVRKCVVNPGNDLTILNIGQEVTLTYFHWHKYGVRKRVLVLYQTACCRSSIDLPFLEGRTQARCVIGMHM